jgi:hypothetical protein
MIMATAAQIEAYDKAGVLTARNPADRIAEITKHLGDACAGNDLRAQMVKVAATAIEAIEQHDPETAQQTQFYADLGEQSHA